MKEQRRKMDRCLAVATERSAKKFFDDLRRMKPSDLVDRLRKPLVDAGGA